MNQTIQINAHPHKGQLEVHRNPARFRVLACGRRWGKTRLGVNECLDVASTGGRAWWIAPSYKMSEVGWRPLRRMGTKVGAEVRKVDRQIVLPSGGDVTVRSADNPDSLRGEGLDFVVLDECAFMGEAVWTEAIRPALSDRQGRAMFISTPKGRNWFWRMFQRGLDGGEWASWQRPTADNPYIVPEEIEAARLTLPELTFEQEYLAVFLENEGTVFRNIATCMSAPLDTSILQHERHRIVAGVDWGKQSDFTAISLGCATCYQEIARDRFNKIDYAFQRGRLRALCEAWKPTGILAERNSMGEPIIEQLLRDGMPILTGPDEHPGFMTTAQSKPQLIENLALTLERGQWQFQDDPIWTGELEAYERQISPITGRSQYSAPEGMHDDTVIARALMIWASGNSIPLPEPVTQRSKWITEHTDDGESRWRRY